MQQAEAYDTGCQRCPRLLNLYQAVVTHTHPSKTFQPADGSLDYPPHFPQSTAMRLTPPSDIRINPQPSQQATCRVAVETSIRIQFVGQLLGAPRLAPDLREVQDHGQQLRVV